MPFSSTWACHKTLASLPSKPIRTTKSSRPHRRPRLREKKPLRHQTLKKQEWYVISLNSEPWSMFVSRERNMIAGRENAAQQFRLSLSISVMLSLCSLLTIKLLFFFFWLSAQGIDLVAGGKSKKSKRTAPKSDDIYLKLLVKVPTSNKHSVSLPHSKKKKKFFFSLKVESFGSGHCVNGSVCLWSAVQVSRTENREQIQCDDIEAAVHEQGEQGPTVALEADQIHARKGWCFGFGSWFRLVCRACHCGWF